MNTTFEKNFSEFEISIETELMKIIDESNLIFSREEVYEEIENIVEDSSKFTLKDTEEILEDFISFDDDRTSEKFYELISIKVKMFNFWKNYMK